MENEKVDMKIVKFEQMINEIHYYLWRSRVVPYPKDGDFVGTVISPFYLDHYLNISDYCKIVGNNTFCSKSKDFDEEKWDILKETQELLERLHISQGGAFSQGHWGNPCGMSLSRAHVRYNSIFWLLFMAAIDEEIYNYELSSIVDLAYCFKFNEPMVRDWCKVIDYILSGNTLCKESELELETTEGNEYFLYKD